MVSVSQTRLRVLIRIFIYCAVFPMGRRTSPGGFGAVPEILPAEVLKVSASVKFADY